MALIIDTVGALAKRLASLPAQARLHIYADSEGLRVTAEWPGGANMVLQAPNATPVVSGTFIADDAEFDN